MKAHLRAAPRLLARAISETFDTMGALSRLTVIALIAFAGGADRAAAQQVVAGALPGPTLDVRRRHPGRPRDAGAHARGARCGRVVRAGRGCHPRRPAAVAEPGDRHHHAEGGLRRGRARDLRRRRQRRRGRGRARVPRRARRARADARRRGLHGPPRRPRAVLPGRGQAVRQGHRRRPGDGADARCLRRRDRRRALPEHHGPAARPASPRRGRPGADDRDQHDLPVPAPARTGAPGPVAVHERGGGELGRRAGGRVPGRLLPALARRAARLRARAIGARGVRPGRGHPAARCGSAAGARWRSRPVRRRSGTRGGW